MIMPTSGHRTPTLPSGYLATKAAAVRAARRTAAPRGSALDALRAAALEMPPPPLFGAALIAGEEIALIAEFKRRSPSGGGGSRGRPQPAEAAVAASGYVACGARAVSILTDAADFGGSLEDLARAAASARAPVLRKDFIVDVAALYEARRAGAAATLLIARILTAEELRELLAAAREVALECLVEVHDEHDIDRAIDAGADIIGINNRDLNTLTTSLDVTLRLAPHVPWDRILVSESGIRNTADVARVRDAGAHAVLVGGALMRLERTERCNAVGFLASVPRQGGGDVA